MPPLCIPVVNDTANHAANPTARHLATNLATALTVLVAVIFLGGCDKAIAPAEVNEMTLRGVYGAALSDDGRFAVSGSMLHGISLWRIADWERLYDWNHDSAQSTNMIAADFSPDGRWVLTADAQTLALWNVSTGENLRYWATPAEVLSVQLSADGQVALLGLVNHTAVLFDVRRGGVLRTFIHSDRVNSVALSDDGTVAVTGSDDFTAVAWNPRTGEVLKRIKHEDRVQLVTLSHDGTLAMSMSRYDKALLWHPGSEADIEKIPLSASRLQRGMQFTAARFSRDKQWLLTGQADKRVTLWSLNPLQQTAQWKLPQRKIWKPVGAVALDMAFAEEAGMCHVVASNGYLASFDCSRTSTPTP